MMLEEIPIIMQLISVWREAKGKRVDGAILKVLRKRTAVTPAELSGWTGYSEKEIQGRVDALEIKGVVRTFNGYVALKSSIRS